MNSVPVAGRQALYLQNMGENLAIATQEGRAPNQRETRMLPPELARSARSLTGGSADRSQFAYGARLLGASSIAVRVSAAERGITDPRVASLARVRAHNARSGDPGRQPFRPTDDPDGPRPVILVSNKTIPIQAVHTVDGTGYSALGDGKLAPVRAGDPLYRPDGTPVPHLHELRDIYKAYHLADVDMAGVGERRPPFSSNRAIARQDQEFAARCVEQGIPARPPDPAERHKLQVESGIDRMVEAALRFADARGAPFVVETSPDLTEATFSAVSRPPVVELPDPASSLGVDERASSIARAVSQAALFASLSERAVRIEVARVGTSELPGHFQVRQPPSQVVQRVAAHAAERPSYLDQAHLDRASLVASYAALNAVTAMGATYAPGPEAQDDRVRSAWARELHRIGGMEDLSRELTQIERGMAARPVASGLPARVLERTPMPVPDDGGGGSPPPPPARVPGSDLDDSPPRPAPPHRRQVYFPTSDPPDRLVPPQRVSPGDPPIVPDASPPQGEKVPPSAPPAAPRVSVRPGGDPSVAPSAARPAPQQQREPAPERGRSGGLDR